MGLQMTLRREDGTEAAEMNWFGPYGLSAWADGNYTYFTGKTPKQPRTIWGITHTWTYARSVEIDRELFLRMVLKRGEVLMNLTESYFFVTAALYQSEIVPNQRCFPMADYRRIRGQVYDGERIGIPVELFTFLDVGYRKTIGTAMYQAWYEQLIAFADLMQDTSLSFYCSV